MSFATLLGVLSFFVLYGGLAPWLRAGGLGEDNFLPLVYTVLYALAAMALFFRLLRRRSFSFRPWMLWPVAYVLLATASIAWSDVPMLSARRAVALAGAMVFASWLASNWDDRRIIKTVALALGVIAVLSVAMLVFAPQLAVHAAPSSHAGDWRGALLHKNLLGREMALGALLSLTLGVGAWDLRRRLAWWATSMLMIVLVIGSGSVTGLILLLAGGIAFALIAIPAANGMERAVRRLVRTLAVAAVALTLVFGAEPILNVLGRDTTLTGRDRIWELSAGYIQANPMGHGYGAFWDGPGGEEVSRRLGYRVIHSHNSLLELGLDLGLLGPALILVLLARVIYLVVRDRRPWFGSARATLVMVLVYACVVSASDTVLTGPNSPTLVLLTTLVLMPARAGGVRRSAPVATGAAIERARM